MNVSDLFTTPQELDEAAEARYLDTEFKLGGPTYPELSFEEKVRLRQEVIASVGRRRRLEA